MVSKLRIIISQDKHNALGNRKLLSETIQKQELIVKIAAREDYSDLRRIAPELKPVEVSAHIKDEEIWETLLPMMKTTTKLAPTSNESLGAAGTKRRRESEQAGKSAKKSLPKVQDFSVGAANRAAQVLPPCMTEVCLQFECAHYVL